MKIQTAWSLPGGPANAALTITRSSDFCVKHFIRTLRIPAYQQYGTHNRQRY